MRVYYAEVINDIYMDWNSSYQDRYESERLKNIMKSLYKSDIYRMNLEGNDSS